MADDTVALVMARDRRARDRRRHVGRAVRASSRQQRQGGNAPMKVLNLSGGACKGAYEVPIAATLWERGNYDLVLGTSIGAINGAMIAQDDAAPLRTIWEGLDTKDALLSGLPGLMKPLWWKVLLPGKKPDGLLSLEPMRRLLRARVETRRLRCRVGIGIVSRTTGNYRVEYFDDSSNTADLHDAIIASAAMSGIMEALRKGDEDLVDGGHHHVLAQIDTHLPDPGSDPPYMEMDAVFCTKLAPETKPRCERGVANALLWGVESALHNTALEDLEDLKELAANGAKVRVWAPHSTLGGMLDASKKTIAARLRMGEEAIDHPVIL